MKKAFILLLFTLALSPLFKAEASHMAGFRITYECIAPDQFRVSMIVYRDCDGVGFGNTTVQIGYYNGCTSDGDCPDGTFTAYITPGTGLPVNDECVDLPPTTCFGGSRFGLEAYEFEGIFEVPLGTPDSCQDWWFYWANAVCCRNSSATLAGSGTPYVSAYLNNHNNVNPCNNSSISDIPYVPAFCPNDPVTLVANFSDPDGDSLAMTFQKAVASNGFGGRPCEGDSVNYAAGYQAHRPGSSTTPWFMNPTTGSVSWTPSAVQTVVIVWKVEEWRGNVLTGWTWMDLQVRIEQDPIICTQSKTPTYKQDTVFLSCGDSVINFDLTTNVSCKTVSPTAEEWRLVSAQSGQFIALDSCWILNCNILTNVSPEFRVESYEPLIENGNYYLYTKKGVDGNTFGNQCAKDMAEFDTLVVNVSGCYEYEVPPELINVSVNSITNSDLFLKWLEPAGIDPVFFVSYNIERTEDPSNQPWQPYMKITDLAKFNENDLMPLLQPVNGSNFYSLVVEYEVLDGFEFTRLTPRSNIIGSIHLKNFPGESDPEATIFDLAWNDYWGWTNDLYNVEWTDQDVRNWAIDGTTTDFVYRMDKPAAFGDYLVRNYTDNTHPTAGDLRSYSNWIPMRVPKREIVIPNVITPNGDNMNDLFDIKFIDFYPGTTVKVFNRWGGEVYSSDNYSNDPDKAFGNNVKTGVYYWVVQVPNEEDRKGVVKVIN